MFADIIDLVGHWGRKLKAVTQYCAVYSPNNSFKGVETSKTDFLRDWGKGATSLVVGIATIRKKD